MERKKATRINQPARHVEASVVGTPRYVALFLNPVYIKRYHSLLKD
jgi:hypothetical protein